jgi:hypothetical protein
VQELSQKARLYDELKHRYETLKLVVANNTKK